jgi:pyruvate kinase
VAKSKMTLTKIAPRVSVSDFKRTKIIATVGPATHSYEAILELIKSGANAIRLNFSHGTYEEREQQIKWVRQASLEVSKPIALIQDLQGPKIRLGDFEGVVPVQKGQNVRFRYHADYVREGILPIQYDLSKKVKRGERLCLYDGKVQSKITAVKDGVVHVEIQNDGVLFARRGINLPDTDFEGDIITKKDRQDIAFGSDKGFDYVALSFVQTAGDINRLRALLGNLNYDAKIIAKIETKAATENLEAIVEQSDAIMVARGDLAIEIEPEYVPVVQKKIIDLGRRFCRPTIVATQMLATMAESPQPTRAEVSDVATAVIGGADTVMLSEETSTGKYPIEAVQLMKRVISAVQDEAPYNNLICDSLKLSPQDAISGVVIKLANDIRAAAIVAETKSGATALKIASHRPKLPIIVATSSQRVAQQLAIMYGAMTFIRKDDQSQATKLAEWLQAHEVFKKGDIVVTASGQQSGVVGATDTIKVRAL